jgi:hypothetical protein
LKRFNHSDLQDYAPSSIDAYATDVDLLNQHLSIKHQLLHWRLVVMSALLHIDSSPLYGRSVSRQLTVAFVDQWKSSQLDGTVIDRDLNATAISPITAEWVSSFNFVEPYLRSVFGFLGVTDATFLTAGGTAALNQGLDRDAFLAPHLQVVQSHAQTV